MGTPILAFRDRVGPDLAQQSPPTRLTGVVIARICLFLPCKRGDEYGDDVAYRTSFGEV